MADEIVPDDDIAVTEARAAQMVGFSPRRLRAWADRGIVGPTVSRRLSQRNTVRLYRFGDLVELHVAKALLVEGRSPQQIRKVVEHLRSRDYSAPLRELAFAVQGEHIYFQHPDGIWEGDQAPDQVVLHSVLDLERIRARVRAAAAPRREPRRTGTRVQRRGVVGSKPVFDGTRIPLSAVERTSAEDCRTLGSWKPSPCSPPRTSRRHAGHSAPLCRARHRGASL